MLALGVLARRPKSRVGGVNNGTEEESGKHSLADVTKADDGLMLTPLGMLVGSIPLDFKYSRMIVLGAQMGCAAEAVVMATFLAGGQNADIFLPLQQPNAAGGNGARVSSSLTENEFMSRALRTRQRWDRRLSSEPLAAVGWYPV